MGTVAAGTFGIFILMFWGIMMLIGIGATIFWIVAIVDVAKRRFKDDNTRLLWILVVVLGHLIGAIVYYIVGRPTGWLPEERRLY